MASSGETCLGDCVRSSGTLSGLLPPLKPAGVSGLLAPPCPSSVSSSELRGAPPPSAGPSCLPPRRARLQHRGQRPGAERRGREEPGDGTGQPRPWEARGASGHARRTPPPQRTDTPLRLSDGDKNWEGRTAPVTFLPLNSCRKTAS